eukprot:PhF_6_TR42666/c0_g1_i2/m.64296
MRSWTASPYKLIAAWHCGRNNKTHSNTNLKMFHQRSPPWSPPMMKVTKVVKLAKWNPVTMRTMCSSKLNPTLAFMISRTCFPKSTRKFVGPLSLPRCTDAMSDRL